MHAMRKGSALLSDNDSDAFVKLDIDLHGRVTVGGRVGGSHEDHSLKFEFSTDQTCLPQLVLDFQRLLAQGRNG